ncbi:MAG: DNA polymerase III subunit delta [Myxococcaceae bacterium]|nr:DNA polymerase III subunit delta [Myxococcaceae bacterium]
MSAELEDVLAEAKRGQMAPLYLFAGEEFLVRKGADELVKTLLPDAAVGLNLNVMDGASPREIAQELATLPLFPGTKLVVVRDPEFLAPKKGRTDGLARAKDAWKAGRRKEGARRLLALAARAGWGVAELDPSVPGAPGVEAWREELNIELAEADLAFLAEVARYCREENVSAPEGDTTALVELIHKGVPKGHALVIAASEVDAKNPLVALAKKVGRVVERKVQSTWRGGRRELDLGDPIREILAPLGKRLGPGAEEALKDRVGDNIRLLQSELEKLALASTDKVITADQVRLLVARAREDEFSEMADALQTRNLQAALAYVHAAIDQGAHGLQLLGITTSILRTLLDNAEAMRKYGVRDVARMSSREFEAKVFPLIERDMKAVGRKVSHPFAAYMAMQAASRYSREELLDAIVACAEADVQLKSSGTGRLVLEALLFRVAGRRAA